jgi:hypothetical protein
MNNTRCLLCALPIHGAQIPYCSPRCLQWHAFGVPILKEHAIARERVRNMRRKYVDDVPDRTTGVYLLPDEALAILADLALLRGTTSHIDFPITTDEPTE